MDVQEDSVIRNQPREYVRSAKKAIEILNLLAERRLEASVTELGQALRASASTAHRLLVSLCETGMVEQNADSGRYRLGPRILQLAQAKLDSIDISSEAAPALKRLRFATNETAGLFVAIPAGCLCVQQFQSSHQVRSVSRIGNVFPPAQGAVGRSLRDVARTSIQVEMSPGEVNSDTCAFAAPIIDCAGKVHAAVTLSIPAQRWDETKAAGWARAVRQAAEEVSRCFGWEPGAVGGPSDLPAEPAERGDRA